MVAASALNQLRARLSRAAARTGTPSGRNAGPGPLSAHLAVWLGRRAHDFVRRGRRRRTLARGHANRPLPDRRSCPQPLDAVASDGDMIRVRRGDRSRRDRADSPPLRTTQPEQAPACVQCRDASPQPIAKRTAPTVVIIATDHRPSHQLANGLVSHCERQRLALTCPTRARFHTLCCQLFVKGTGQLATHRLISKVIIMAVATASLASTQRKRSRAVSNG